jgi:hypothetical protein
MGWDCVPGEDRKQTINRILKESEFTKINDGITEAVVTVDCSAISKSGVWLLRRAHRFVSNDEHNPVGVFYDIVFHLIERTDGDYYVKSMSANVHPYYFCCPISIATRFDELASTEDQEACKSWREVYDEMTSKEKARRQFVALTKDAVKRGECPIVAVSGSKVAWKVISGTPYYAQVEEEGAATPILYKVKWSRISAGGGVGNAGG